MSKSEKIVLGGVVAVFLIAGLYWGSKMVNEVSVGLDDNDNATPYQDSTSGFSFQYPKEYSVKEIPASTEGEVRSLLLSKAGQAPSVQIAVSFFDEDIVLTIDRIKADAPDLIMDSPEVVSIGSLTKGVKFGSDVGTNIWFVAKGSLFQLTAFPADAGVLDKIVSSFKM